MRVVILPIITFLAGLVCHGTLEERSCMKDTDVAWLAGVIDGEGSILLNKSRDGVQVQVFVTNTDARLIERVRELFDEIGVSSYVLSEDRRGKKRKVCYKLHVRGMAQARILLPPVRPYLVAKGEQADLMLRFCKLETQSVRGTDGRYMPIDEDEPIAQVRNDIIDRIKLLNKRGVA